VDSGDCGHELIAEQAPASLYEGFLDNRWSAFRNAMP
jgi:hypothetical protein